MRARSLWAVAGLFAVLALAIPVVGCGDDDDDGGSSGDGTAAAETQELDLLLSFNIGLIWAPVIASQDAGLFADQGLDVNVQETDGTSFVTQQIIAGNADYGFASAAGALIAYQEDPELRIVGCQEQRNIFFLSVLADSGIENVDDLKGKTVGLGDEASGEGPLMHAINSTNDLDLKLLPLGFEPAQVIPALENGEVAAYAGGITPTTALETSGKIDIVDITPEEYAPMPADCLMVRQSTLEDPDGRDIVVRLLRALSQGAVFVRANPDAALDLACKAAPQQCEGDARERFAVPYMKKVVEVEEPLGGGDPFQVNSEGWEVAAEVMLKAGVIDKKPDLETFVNSPEVQEIQKEAQDYDVGAVEEAAREFQTG